MKFKKSLTALVFLSASVTAPIASAQDNFLQSIVSRVLTSAVEATVDELQQQASQSVANAAHHVSAETADVATSVKITVLADEHTTSEQKINAQSESKKSFKSE